MSWLARCFKLLRGVLAVLDMFWPRTRRPGVLRKPWIKVLEIAFDAGLRHISFVAFQLCSTKQALQYQTSNQDKFVPGTFDVHALLPTSTKRGHAGLGTRRRMYKVDAM
jgi:hypothetical protein